DAVEREMLELFHRHVVHILAPGKMSPPAQIAFFACVFGDEIKIMGSLRQIIKVASMNVPGENFESSHAPLSPHEAQEKDVSRSLRASSSTRRVVIPSAQGWPMGQSRCSQGRQDTGNWITRWRDASSGAHRSGSDPRHITTLGT